MNDANFLIENGVNIKESLELFGNMEMYNSTLKDFIKEIGPRLEKIKKYKEISDMAKYAIEVHALKSDSKYFGFDKLSNLALNHEIESKKNNMFYVVDHYDELVNEANRVINILKKYLGQNIETPVKNTKDTLPILDKTILVVDDSNVTRNFVMKIFSSTYNVIVAHDGNDAINIIANNLDGKIVALLLDLNMPNVNGYDVLNYFRTNNLFSKIPVSIITSDNSMETRNKVFSYGIVDILVKPFNEYQLKQVLDKTIYFNQQI